MAVALHPTNMVPQERWTDCDGQAMRYVRTGGGPPLLLIHGLLGGAFCWRLVVPFLARHYTVYAVDLPGSGLSDAGAHTDCSMQRHAQRLAAFAADLGMENLGIMGTSFGGAIAMLLAHRLAAEGRPANALALISPVNPWSANGSGRIRFFSSALGALLLKLTMPYSRPVHNYALRRMYADCKRIPPGTAEGYIPMIIRPGRAENVVTTLRCWWRDIESLRRAIPTINLPTLLLWGTDDLAVDPQSLRIVQEKLPNCEAVEMPGVGHLPFEEAPDEFNRHVLKFLRQHIP